MLPIYDKKISKNHKTSLIKSIENWLVIYHGEVAVLALMEVLKISVYLQSQLRELEEFDLDFLHRLHRI
jgi:hypothetical protein